MYLTTKEMFDFLEKRYYGSVGEWSCCGNCCKYSLFKTLLCNATDNKEYKYVQLCPIAFRSNPGQTDKELLKTFYSCLLSDLAFECQRGWVTFFDTDLIAFVV